MTTVFFLFLLHLSVGLLATLPLVPERAGAKYFKFVSGFGIEDSNRGIRPMSRCVEYAIKRTPLNRSDCLLVLCGRIELRF